MEIGKELLYLSNEDQINVDLDMTIVLDTLAEAHAAYVQGQCQTPEKPHMDILSSDCFLSGYPAVINDTPYMGLKWLSSYSSNPDKGLPGITGLIIINDRETGIPVCIMNCGYLTALRTGGMDGLAMRYTAPADVEDCCVIGCGLEARTNFMAVYAANQGIKRVHCWSRTKRSAELFAEEMTPKFPEVQFIVEDDAKKTVQSSKVILICAPFLFTGETRMIAADWVQEGSTVYSVNSDGSFLLEALHIFDRVYTDCTDGYERRMKSGMLSRLLPPDCIQLGDVVLGRAPGRQNDKEILLVACEGMGINDVSVGEKMYRKAVEKGIGTVLRL